MDGDCSSRRRREPPNWSELPTEILELIVKRLGSVDTVRFKAVCSPWNHAGKSYISAPFFTLVPQPPMLMIPCPEDEEDLFPCGEEKFKDIQTRRFFSSTENKFYTVENVFGDIPDAWCVGSSHGWLIIMEDIEKLHLFNPFSRDRIDLPAIAHSSLHAQLARHTQELPEEGGDDSWTNIRDIRGQNPREKYIDYAYEDILFHRGYLYALLGLDRGLFSGCEAFVVVVWDFTQYFPTKTVQFPVEIKNQNLSIVSSKEYLVESSGDILVARRISKTTTVKQGQGKEASDLQPICPYRTFQFDIYRLCFSSKTLEEVECLHDRVLFLGGAHSMSLSSRDFPECEGNSIYFTDFKWNEIKNIRPTKYFTDVDGHDIGIYNLKDKVVKPMPDCQLIDECKIDSPTFWIVPNPWPSTAS